MCPYDAPSGYRRRNLSCPRVGTLLARTVRRSRARISPRWTLYSSMISRKFAGLFEMRLAANTWIQLSCANRIANSTAMANASRLICLSTGGLHLHPARGRLRRPGGHPDEEREQDEVRQQARASVRDERQRDAGERDHACHAAHDDERLHAEDRGETGGEQLPELVLLLDRGLERLAHEHHEQQQHRGVAEQADLLAD